VGAHALTPSRATTSARRHRDRLGHQVPPARRLRDPQRTCPSTTRAGPTRPRLPRHHRSRGLFYLLQRRGRAARVVSDPEVFSAKVNPPQTTRAKLRGDFIRAAQEKRRDFTVDWVHLKLNDQAQRTVLCKDPFLAQDARVERLIEGIQPLITGTGPKVKAGQTAVVTYTGALWRNGKVFDSSFAHSGKFSFAVGGKQVISGWDKGVVNQPVGSRLLLVVPPDEGYGKEGSGEIKGTDTLVFVVDILSAY
jgi:FKBP-type peptidyl-prolyl cis-trans isomerase